MTHLPSSPGHSDADLPNGHLSNGHLEDERLLLLAESALPPDEAAIALAHLDGCATCSRRREQLRAAEAALLRMGPGGGEEPDASDARQARERFERQLSETPPASRWPGVGGLATAAVIGLALLGWQAMADRSAAGPAASTVAHDGRSLPIRSITPGATLAVEARDLCKQMPWEPAPIPDGVRDMVLRAYGMERVPDHEYELDYLITPDLGGSPDPRNLWPEPYHSPVWNARVKDELETLLPRLVCEGKVDLRTAQQDIAADWIAAYKKYFKTDRPLRRS